MNPYTSLVVSDEGIATITMLGCSERSRKWGTPVKEHRLEPGMVESLMQNLETCELRKDIFCVIVVGEGFFWSNGLDLAWIDANDKKLKQQFLARLNELMVKILTFPIPTIGAMNGHWCAAGGMLGLCFDYRVMNEDRGYFFIPAVDLGIVYSSFQIELMKSKLPQYLHREIICFNSSRWKARELLQHQVIDAAVPKEDVLRISQNIALSMIEKGQGPARNALKPIKEKVYSQVLATLSQKDGGAMEFDGRKRGRHYAAPSLSRL